MRFDTNWNPDEIRRPSSRSAAQAQIPTYGTKCSQTQCPQTQVSSHSGGQTVQ